jgi:hypothetical protein
MNRAITATANLLDQLEQLGWVPLGDVWLLPVAHFRVALKVDFFLTEIQGESLSGNIFMLSAMISVLFLSSLTSPPSNVERVGTAYDWCDCNAGSKTLSVW